MMKFIEKPNLPECRVSRIICGDIPKEAESFLLQRKVEIIRCEPNFNIDGAVKLHADMCAVHLGENEIIVDKNQRELITKLKNLQFDVIETEKIIAGEYPGDIKLNVALFGKNAVGAFRYSDSALIKAIKPFDRYNVKQGYAKCSILPITQDAAITDDVSVYNVLKNHFDVLLIDKGDIVLDGHEYGFIGGASAKISKDEIIFFGDLKCHRNYREILNFLSKYSCRAVFFDNIPLTDVGGVITVNEFD